MLKAEIKEKTVEKYLATIDTYIEETAEAFIKPIEDDEDYTAACDVLFEVASLKKQTAAEKEKVVGAAKTIIETVSGWFRPREQRLIEREETVKALVRAYNIDREEERLSLAKKATSLAKIDPKQAREMQSRAEAVLPPKVKGIAFVGKLEVEVLEESKVPERFFKKVIDTAALKAAAEAGEITEKNAGGMGLSLTDARSVRVTPSQRADGGGK